ncbi:hypothetical protein pf16_226 [Pseudomonas phage pf16]|uniref:Uncharacterized protein n=1 Tax=Pseudomonas phage pf16 TaxID=1815630 RepID=A0A1S5R412_9CAUD|nr:hypothetical protein FDG98_gp072 [Pseudomonas phage pf16]AND75149.1 hypothetical protein pf16_226 [Pseudomonas phage pf16]
MKKITLANLAAATAQQVFDQVAAHLLHQNAKAQKVREGTTINDCMYRGENGTKCAAGCLIADDEYKPEMDKEDAVRGTSWPSLITRKLVPSTPHDRLIRALQHVHDDHEPINFKRELHRTAEEFGLNTDVLDKVTLANLEYKTAQEVFDQAAVHLLTQKEQSTDVNGGVRCVYRGKNGMKCAAGALIADHEYKPEMDKHGMSGWYALIDRELVPDTHKGLIAGLQGVHDNFMGPDDLRVMLCDLATSHKLNTDAIKGM